MALWSVEWCKNLVLTLELPHLKNCLMNFCLIALLADERDKSQGSISNWTVQKCGKQFMCPASGNYARWYTICALQREKA